WLIRTGLDKKFVELFISGKKIRKIDRTLFVLSNFYLFLEELAHKNWISTLTYLYCTIALI
ncbi:hypothetical protein, partial [Carnobacterium sp.]|uniref:hypothetical protein n=1 Tax=Carnobacterium sp. TaxID=48221 RepID=UPI002FC6FFEB